MQLGKPIDAMTPEEIDAWKEWLANQGENPSPLDIPASKSGSVFTYDEEYGATVETVPGNRRYLLGVRDGQIVRVQELECGRLRDRKVG